MFLFILLILVVIWWKYDLFRFVFFLHWILFETFDYYTFGHQCCNFIFKIRLPFVTDRVHFFNTFLLMRKKLPYKVQEDKQFVIQKLWESSTLIFRLTVDAMRNLSHEICWSFFIKRITMEWLGLFLSFFVFDRFLFWVIYIFLLDITSIPIYNLSPTLTKI